MPPFRGPELDLDPPVRLDLWAILLSVGIVVGTVAPPLAPLLVASCLIVAVAALLWRDLVPVEWRLMAILGPVFAAAGQQCSALRVGRGCGCNLT